MNGVFAYLRSTRGFNPENANKTYLLSLSVVANYQIVLPGVNPISEAGTNIAAILGQHGDRSNYALVERGYNAVWLDPSAFSGNLLSSVLIHQLFHLLYGTQSRTAGFGLSESDLAKALGVFQERMNDAQASEASTKILGANCK